jgi:hypothetical protein
METGADVVADRRSCDAGRRPAYEHWKRARKDHGLMGINALTMQMLRAYDRQGRNAESHAWRGGLLRWSRRRKQEN